jgi:ComF family protein
MANVLPQITKLKRIALDLLFPQWCIGCGREGDILCPSCRLLLPQLESPVSTGSPAEIGGVLAPYAFDGTIRRAIHELKYRNIRALAEPLAGLLHGYLLAHPVPADVLVPVPLHPRRLRERGYNQSELLARGLGRLAGLPVIADCLVRRRYTSSQARAAGVQQRRSQIEGAFACRDGRLAGMRVLLIDDVSTSGATFSACAGAAGEGGTVSVWGLAVAAEL